MRSTRSHSTSRSRSPDDGNALLGFAVGAPLIGLMLVTVVEMSGVVWQRELSVELLRRSVASAARLHGSRAASSAQFATAARAAGVDVTAISWAESAFDDVTVLAGTVTLKPVGVTLLPGLSLTLVSSAVVE